MTLAKFYALLAKHDWFFTFSDDPAAYRRGAANLNTLETISKSSPAHAELLKGFSAHHFSGPMFGSAVVPLPANPDTAALQIGTTTCKAASANEMPLSELHSLWDQLTAVPTVFEGEDVDTIEEAFLHFPVGTHREAIWHWFEAQNAAFVVGAVLQGVQDAEPARTS